MIVLPQAAVAHRAEQFSYHHINHINVILADELLAIGVDSVLLIDTAGNILLKHSNGLFKDVLYPLAALAAGNFTAVKKIADIIGEKKFSLFFHQGENESIYYSEIHDELLLVVVFSTRIALGGVRLHVKRAVESIKEVIA